VKPHEERNIIKRFFSITSDFGNHAVFIYVTDTAFPSLEAKKVEKKNKRVYPFTDNADSGDIE
jgi:hypothetical protein